MNPIAKALLALSVGLFSLSAAADEFVGVLAGPSFVNQGVKLKLNFGFETAGKLDPHWSLGFLVNFENLGTAISATTDSATLTSFLGGVTYHGWPNNRGPWVGVRGGIGVLNNVNSVGGAGSVGGSANEVAFGFALGYDKQLGDEWTWGPQAQAIVVNTSGSPLIVFNAAITLRYWPE
jgi:hypothetical protein